MKKKTLLVITPGKNVQRDCVFTIVVAETGEGLASHLCSCAGFAYGDLYRDRPERIEEWTNRFGELEVKYIDETDITEAELIRRNNEWYASVKQTENQAS